MCVDFGVAFEEFIEGSEEALEAVAIEGEADTVGLSAMQSR